MIRKKIFFFLKIGISVMVVLYLFKSGRLTEDSIAKIFRLDMLPFFFLAGLSFFIGQVLAAERLSLLLRMIALKVPFRISFRLTMIGSFFNMVIPGAVGGDIVKGYYLAKNEAGTVGKSSGIVIMDRALGFLSLLLLSTISILYLYIRHRDILNAYHSAMLLMLIITVLGLSLFSALIIFGRNEQIRRMFKNLAYLLFRNGVFYDMAVGVGKVSKNRKTLVRSFLLSIAIQLAALSGVVILLNTAAGKLPDIITISAVSSVVMAIGVIPVTPGNIGWTELVASIGWSLAGSRAGGEVFFYWRIVSILFSLPGAIFYFFPKYFAITQEKPKTGIGRIKGGENI